MPNNILLSSKISWNTTIPNKSSKKKAEVSLQMIDLLCARGTPPAIQSLAALIWKPDPELLAYFFDALQLELLEIKAAYDKQEIEADVAKIRVNNILCYLAYTAPDTCDRATINIPVFKNRPCTLEAYTIEPIEVTRKWMRFLASPYYAYGLTPKNSETAPSQLLFMGTTYPASRGSLWTYIADLIPGLSVGNLLFSTGKNAIEKWINKQKTEKEKILCHGESLGGSMSIFAAEAFPEKINSMAHVPAGRLFYKKSSFNGTNVTIIMQGQDPVAKMGSLPKDATYYYVEPNNDETQGPVYAKKPGFIGRFFSHAASLIGHPNARLEQTNHPSQSIDPAHRRWTAFLIIASIISIPFLIAALIINTLFRILSAPFYRFYRDSQKLKKEIPHMFQLKSETPEPNNTDTIAPAPVLTDKPVETIVEIPKDTFVIAPNNKKA